MMITVSLLSYIMMSYVLSKTMSPGYYNSLMDIDNSPQSYNSLTNHNNNDVHTKGNNNENGEETKVVGNIPTGNSGNQASYAPESENDGYAPHIAGVDEGNAENTNLGNDTVESADDMFKDQNAHTQPEKEQEAIYTHEQEVGPTAHDINIIN